MIHEIIRHALFFLYILKYLKMSFTMSYLFQNIINHEVKCINYLKIKDYDDIE